MRACQSVYGVDTALCCKSRTVSVRRPLGATPIYGDVQVLSLAYTDQQSSESRRSTIQDTRCGTVSTDCVTHSISMLPVGTGSFRPKFSTLTVPLLLEPRPAG